MLRSRLPIALVPVASAHCSVLQARRPQANARQRLLQLRVPRKCADGRGTARVREDGHRWACHAGGAVCPARLSDRLVLPPTRGLLSSPVQKAAADAGRHRSHASLDISASEESPCEGYRQAGTEEEVLEATGQEAKSRQLWRRPLYRQRRVLRRRHQHGLHLLLARLRARRRLLFQQQRLQVESRGRHSPTSHQTVRQPCA